MLVGNATILTWYQGNFTGVLNKPTGSEAMSGFKGDVKKTC